MPSYDEYSLPILLVELTYGETQVMHSSYVKLGYAVQALTEEGSKKQFRYVNTVKLNFPKDAEEWVVDKDSNLEEIWQRAMTTPLGKPRGS